MKLYFDAMLWIYFFERHPIYFASIFALRQRAQAARATLLQSHLILAETLVMPKRTGNLFLAEQYRRFFTSSPVTLVPFTAIVAERFADIRATTRVKPADALHLALAASAQTDYFVTNDAKLHSLSVPGIARICAPYDVP